MEKQFIISESVANAVLQYLSGCPYGQVAPLVQGIQSITPVDIEAMYVELEELRKINKECVGVAKETLSFAENTFAVGTDNAALRPLKNN